MTLKMSRRGFLKTSAVVSTSTLIGRPYRRHLPKIREGLRERKARSRKYRVHAGNATGGVHCLDTLKTGVSLKLKGTPICSQKERFVHVPSPFPRNFTTRFVYATRSGVLGRRVRANGNALAGKKRIRRPPKDLQKSAKSMDGTPSPTNMVQDATCSSSKPLTGFG